ncbi:putative PurR-regulated permease PerM [Actinophytocola algeriensis]|uniref:Putative PurR-regulated permease PerM n=1 Tax=Actinophytocola algeriensis TaxID=1768010 RepID=A0A7W7VDZ8_9PSEU|nr:putative PurR-regulated permease PerM [Actinophytocola algeriensis]MBE1478153.1 putative PurR-regulated permease PerM [Actinophytocola algeriensis]
MTSPPEEKSPPPTRRRRRTPPQDVTGLVPTGLRVSAALAWRFLMVIAALYVIIWLAGYFSHLVVPAAIALLLAALMAPGVERLVRWSVPRGLAAAIVMIAGIGVLGGLLTFVIIQFTQGLPELQSQVSDSLDQIRTWLTEGPLHLRDEQITSFIDNTIDTIQENQAAITEGALTTATTIGEILTGFLLTVFVLIFFLYDGPGIWKFVTRGVPSRVRDRVDVAGRRGFGALVSYVRATAAVALVDAVGIGIGLAIMQVPLVIPLSALVFLSAFVPIIGAVLAGTVAVLIALVANGFIAAVVVLAIVVLVMQLESHVLQPWLLGRAVRLHPLAVVLAITAGLLAAGIAGALLSVPLLAVLNAGVKSLVNDTDTEPEDIDVLNQDDQAPPGGDAEEDTKATWKP